MQEPSRQPEVDNDFTGLRCPKCEYDLTGLPQAQCPECGTKFVGIEVRISALKAAENRAFLERSAKWTLALATTLLLIQFLIEFYLAVITDRNSVPPLMERIIGIVLLPYVIAGHTFLIILGVIETGWAVQARARKAFWIAIGAVLVAVGGIYHFCTTQFVY